MIFFFIDGIRFCLRLALRPITAAVHPSIQIWFRLTNSSMGTFFRGWGGIEGFFEKQKSIQFCKFKKRKNFQAAFGIFQKIFLKFPSKF